MPTEDFKAVLSSIDKDIDTHNSKANDFLSVVHIVLFVAALFAFIYVAPGIAEKALPDAENDFRAAQKAHLAQIEAFTKQFHRAPYPVSSDQYRELEKSGSISDEVRQAYAITTNQPQEHIPKVLRFLKALKVEDSRMEVLSKLIPLILGGVLAGFLLTYRFHMQAAKEFTLKKIELLAGTAQPKSTSAPKGDAY